MDRPRRSNTFSDLHKRRPVGFANIPARRGEDSNRLKIDRRARRTECFNHFRNIEQNICEETVSKEDVQVKNRKKELQEYLQKKKVLKEKEAQIKKKRPPFVVGIPHHGTSPVLKEITNAKVQNKMRNPIQKNVEVRSQRVTRASTKKDMGGHDVKKNFTLVAVNKRNITVNNVKTAFPLQAFPIVEMKKFTFDTAGSSRPLTAAGSSRPLTSPLTPTVLKRSAKKNVNFTYRPPLVNKNVHLLKTSSVTSVGCTETLATALSDPEEPVFPETLSEDNCTDPQPNFPMFVKLENEVEEKRPLEGTTFNLQTRRKSKRFSNRKHFSPILEPPQLKSREAAVHRNSLEIEKSRLLELADKWQCTAKQNVLPPDVTDEIDSIVGQTRLLTKDKFKQFSGLVDQFENPDPSERNISNDDLVGFWEMLYLQVEALDKRYSELECLQRNNWIQSSPIFKKKKHPASIAKKKPTKTTSSLFREFIKNKRTQASTSKDHTTNKSTEIHEEETMTSPVPNTRVSGSKDLTQQKTPRNSFSALIAMMISSPGRSVGQMNSSQLAATIPGSDTKVKIESHNTPTEKKSVQETRDETPLLRRSARKPSPRQHCAMCDSPDCRDECNLGSKNREQAKLSSKKKFKLKPSRLVVPKEPDEEQDKDVKMNPYNSKVRKSTRIQNSEELSFEGKNVGSLPTGDQSLRRSSRKARFSKVTFSQSVQERSSLKLPSTPYKKSGKTNNLDDEN